MTQTSWVQALFRSGSHTSRDVRLDYCWLFGLGLLLIATGIGLRDPWPADEPRFALVVRDMVATGEWLLPRVGGDVYGDKPPLYFWAMGLALLATGSLRIAFLLPSLLSGLACLVMIYDLGRRLWNRETGLAAALALSFTVQFVWQVRQAQIDATLLFWCVLSLYGLLRHLLLGPAWGWYAVGWAAAGFGVITKGVGFLPLLILIPFALMRDQHWSPRTRNAGVAMWAIGLPAFLAAVATWLVPIGGSLVSQEVLARTSIFVTADGAVEARFRAGLPADGRRILGDAAVRLLTGDTVTLNEIEVNDKLRGRRTLVRIFEEGWLDLEVEPCGELDRAHGARALAGPKRPLVGGNGVGRFGRGRDTVAGAAGAVPTTLRADRARGFFEYPFEQLGFIAQNPTAH